MEVFRIQDLTYYYPGQEKPSLNGINLTVKEGEFILLLGRSGSGKSTLGGLFNGIVPEFYGGKIAGKVHGKTEAGMVFQDPEKQLVMDNVERELAFGLENLGIDRESMKKRVMEALSFMNIWDIRNSRTYELSGGEKQKVVIGSVTAMGYRLFVFDEPTSQLDPISAEEILNIIKRLNEELGYTIILIEQRMDRCFHLADRVLFMEDGKIVFDSSPQDFIKWSVRHNVGFIPPMSEFFAKLGEQEVPVMVKEGRQKLKKLAGQIRGKTVNHYCECTGQNVVELKKVSFSYDGAKKVLDGISLSVHKGEIMAIMGQNGSGKSTMLKIISGLLKPRLGSVKVNGDVGFVSQNPNDYLFHDTVYEELKFTLDNKKIQDVSIIERVMKLLEIEKYSDKNPRDLSGGERQRVAICSVLAGQPDILIMDEPTRGLDKALKDKLGEVILKLRDKGKTVIIVTHDVEFAAAYCDRVCFLFDGSIAQVGDKYDVLTSGIYYSTQMNKLFRGYCESIITIEDAVNLINKCGGVA